MKKIDKYYLDELTGDLFDLEAKSSVGLAKEVATKINELVDSYNHLIEVDYQKFNEQDGRIRQAILYMKDNLEDTLRDLMNLLIKDGYVDNRIKEHISTLIERVDNLIGNIKEGSTSMDAEVIDARIGYKGQTFNNVGNSIRSQIKEVRNLYKEILNLISEKSGNNFINIENVIPEVFEEELSIAFDVLKQEIVLNGNTTKQNSFYVFCDGKLIENTLGEPYLIFKNILDYTENGTWGINVFYTDGSSSGFVNYSNVNFFLPVEQNKIIEKIRVVLSEGFEFNKTRIPLYGSYYNNGFLEQDKMYILKEELENEKSLVGKKWVTIGDSITANTGNTGDFWQKQVADYFGLDYIICGEGGSTTSNFINIDSLANIPNDVDYITVMGGTNDNSQNLPLEVAGDEYYYNSGHYKGSIRKVIKFLQENYPNAKIIFSTCIGARLDEVGKNQDLPFKNANGNTLHEFAKKCIETCEEMSIPCINLAGEVGINSLNASKYLSDNIHPNNDGYKKIAEVYIRNFKNLI